MKASTHQAAHYLAPRVSVIAHCVTPVHPLSHTAEEAEVRRQAAELREFDRMMAEAEEKRRVDEWRRRSM